MSTTCGVCSEKPSKYKCPVCLIPYCSVQCCRRHSQDKCQPAENPEESTVRSSDHQGYDFVTEDTVPVEKLKELESSEGVKMALWNPHVREMLSAVENSSNPTRAIQLAMMEPIFVEFAAECLRVVEPCEERDSVAEMLLEGNDL